MRLTGCISWGWSKSCRRHYISCGTVFLVDPSEHEGLCVGKRVWLTAKHVVDQIDVKHTVILGQDGTSPVPILAKWQSPTLDFAVLLSQQHKFLSASGFRLTDSELSSDLKAGTPLRCWGFPRSTDMGATALLSRGYVSRGPNGVNIGGQVNPNLVFNMDVHHGNSGGPLVHEETNTACGVVIIKHKDLPPDSRAIIAQIAARTSAIAVDGNKLGDDFLSMFRILEASMHLGMGEALQVHITQPHFHLALSELSQAASTMQTPAAADNNTTHVSAALPADFPPVFKTTGPV